MAKKEFLSYIAVLPVNIWYDHMVYQHDGLGCTWVM